MISLGLVAYYKSRQNELKIKADKVEVEQRFLRAQLNPHFIFNALIAIQNYMFQNNASKAAILMGNFSKLMRQVLENSREKFIPLSEEMKMLENYMELLKLQSEIGFEYEIIIDESIEDEEEISIPPMFVQPFVENAIEHGIIDHKGDLKIQFEKSSNLIGITVMDNGVGLSKKKLVISETEKEHHSLATSIIKERIEIYNQKLKTDIKLMVSEIKGEDQKIVGTKVALKVPFQMI